MSQTPSQLAAASSGANKAGIFSASDQPSFSVTPSFPVNDGTVGPTQLNAYRQFGTLPGQNALQRGTQSANQTVQRGTQSANQTTSQGSSNTSSVTSPNFVGQIPFFLNAVLSTPAGALPKKPLWVVVFDFDDSIKKTIKKVKTYEPSMPEKWQIDGALDAVTTKRYQDEKGCMFAQTVTIPGDSLNYTQEGITYNSFIRGGVATGRKDFDTLRIGFLNTNVSFVDNVIRPWVVMTGHLGMIARPDSQKYRCNITVYKLGVRSVDKPPYILQQYNFWEACPINVFAEQLDYTDGVPVIKEAEFVYQWYTTSALRNPDVVTRGGSTAEVTARAVNPTAPIEIQRATLVN